MFVSRTLNDYCTREQGPRALLSTRKNKANLGNSAASAFTGYNERIANQQIWQEGRQSRLRRAAMICAWVAKKRKYEQ